MKAPLLTGYAFRAQQRQIDFSGVPGFDLRGLLAVINLPAQQTIYSVTRADLGYTAFAGGVLSLAADTRAMSDADLLLVMYEDGAARLPAGAATDAEIRKLRTVTTTDSDGAIDPGDVVSALAADADRQIILLSNTGNAALAYRFDADPTATAGHALAPGATKAFEAPCPAGELRLFSTDGTTFFVTAG